MGASPRREFPEARKQRCDLKFGGSHAGGGIVRYLNPFNHRLATQAAEATVSRRVPVNRGGKLKCKAIHALISVAPGGVDTYTFFLRRNGVNSALTCVITGAGLEASGFGDVELLDSDIISVICTSTAGAASTVDVEIEAEITG